MSEVQILSPRPRDTPLGELPVVEVTWFLFVVASLILIVTPGQDMILVMSRSIAQGPAAGVATAGGVSVGLVGHTMLATLGLGAILRTSEWLFLLLKLVGAAYLVYLGFQLLRSKPHEFARRGERTTVAVAAVLRRSLSNLSNPKIAVFYFAFLPQFVQPAATHPTLSIFVLGLAFAGLPSWSRGRSGWARGCCPPGSVPARVFLSGCIAAVAQCSSAWGSGWRSSAGREGGGTLHRGSFRPPGRGVLFGVSDPGRGC